MTNHEYNLIIAAIALESEEPIDQVIKEMQEAIYHLFSTVPKTAELPPFLEDIKRAGEIPTVWEFIEYFVDLNKNDGSPFHGLLN